jgi:L-asparaginase
MAKDPNQGNSLAPVEGALTKYLKTMSELEREDMPDVVAHEYSPLIDSSDMGPGDWALLASDIGDNYHHFDGFVVLTGTDTMAYAASALSFMLESLGKPVVFTGSQIPLGEPYNDARKNLIMSIIFACRDTIHEVTIFFHDRLLRACRATKVNTSRLMAFDSPNLDALATIGITIEENENLLRPPPKWRFRVHTRMETRLITLRLAPGFDDTMMRHMINAARESHLKGLILQLYGTGNLPSLKEDFLNVLRDAVAAGVCVVACTQCITGSVMMGHYATGRALEQIGVVSANDMTVEAISAKLAYLLGRGDLSLAEVRNLMGIDLRGELTPQSELPPPPLSSAYQQAIQKQQWRQRRRPTRGAVKY